MDASGTSTAGSTSPEADPSSAKLILELRKLQLEIEQLQEPWYRRPSFILAALPTLLAALSVLYGLTSGYFQATATKLENQRFALEQDIAQLAKQREEVQTQVESLRRGKKLLEDEYVTKYEIARRHSAEQRIQQLEAELNRHGLSVPK